MKLVHWSKNIITKVKSEDQKDGFDIKPRGFWVSDEDEGAGGWKSWCEAESFRLHALRYEHEITLADKANILYLHTPADLHAFTEEYKVTPPGIIEYDSNMFINWHRVAHKYQGIIITPYIWSERLGKLTWYYPWDCASGCIWDSRAIKSVKLVREHKTLEIKDSASHDKIPQTLE